MALAIRGKKREKVIFFPIEKEPLSLFSIPLLLALRPLQTSPCSSSSSSPSFSSSSTSSSSFVFFVSFRLDSPLILLSSSPSNLGIDNYLFKMETAEVISNHIMALYAAKILAYTRQNKTLDIELDHQTSTGAIFIHNSRPGISQSTGPQYERKIDEKYFDKIGGDKLYRLETYRSKGTVSSYSSTQLRCYFVNECEFANPNPPEGCLDLSLIGDKTFLERSTQNTKDLYKSLMEQAADRHGPVIEVVDYEKTHEKRIVIAFKRGGSERFFSTFSDLYHYYDLFSTRKYVEQFSNGFTIMSVYLRPAGNVKAPPIEHSIQQIVRETSLIYCLPNTPFRELFRAKNLSVQETTYAYVTWIFCQHFLNRLGSEYAVLSKILDANDSAQMAVLDKIKKRLREDTFTREYLLDIMLEYPELLKLCYVNFAVSHHINAQKIKKRSIKPTLSYQRLQEDPVLSEEETLEKIKQTVSNNHEFMVFESLLTFNKHVLKTNFYQPTKVALSFRLNPAFLPEIEYPIALFGMFLVIGSEFRGFHLRFQDVARGGIRIVKSQNRESFSINCKTLFDENYNLAATQQRKNKDIPEGGSKGTILLDPERQDRAKIAFEKYVDAVLDLVTEAVIPGIKDQIVDLYGKPEILFFGPDEGTADYMNWASSHAKLRGAGFWKAFTTGKSPDRGGIPHDEFGMTTRSVHQYVVGIFRKLGIQEDKITKFQTGGPDGDLGSNEIKISQDRTIAIVDGSGVLCDPQGINREELLRLAKERKMIYHFDASKLSPQGFRVLVNEKKVTLPDGTVVDRCMEFRNLFHLHDSSSADLFVPCGGRPEAVNINNVHHMFKDGKPRFKYIVEGANLFFTQAARLHLEKSGVVMFKDASANKGGVTSSSLEVLAALALTDEDFEKHMCVRDHTNPPQFYQDYVTEVQTIIEENARLEFECIWEENAKSGIAKSILSDTLSNTINSMADQMESSGFWANVALRKVVFSKAVPQTLLKQFGYDGVISRVPENYLKAIFHSYLASRFIYTYGTSPSQFAFFEFMSKLQTEVK